MQIDRYTKVVLTVISITLIVLAVNGIKPITSVQAAPQGAARIWAYATLEIVITPYSETGRQMSYKRTCFDFSGKQFACSTFDEALDTVGKSGMELLTVTTEQREGNTTDVKYIFRF